MSTAHMTDLLHTYIIIITLRPRGRGGEGREKDRGRARESSRNTLLYCCGPHHRSNYINYIIEFVRSRSPGREGGRQAEPEEPARTHERTHTAEEATAAYWSVCDRRPTESV
eukprot:GHVU01133199.1.p1 GENE.GHVU01133199.1~~GHVU01133199.1.p1  ORF type:complete len:112 (+),score=3.05 GHVU01133199.1:426-761(+)